MSVGADAQKLNIYAACAFDCFGITLALLLPILCVAVKKINIFFFNINLIKKIVVHKTIVAVFIVFRQIAILIKVKGFYVLKADALFVISLNKFFICGHG